MKTSRKGFILLVLQDSAKQVPLYFSDCSLLRNQQRNPSSDLWDPLWLEATGNAKSGLWALFFLHNHFLECFRIWYILISKMKINTTWASVLQPSFPIVLLFQNQWNALHNEWNLFLLGSLNNNLGPITLASPPWTSCTSQPPHMLVKNLNLLTSPLKFQSSGKWSRPCST